MNLHMGFIIGGALFAAMALCVIAVVSVKLRRGWQRLERNMMNLQNELTAIRKEQTLAMEGSYGMGQRMIRLERRLKTFAQDAQMATDALDENTFSYTQAAQMVEQGADSATIAATCGLSHSEAHLMHKLYNAEAQNQMPSQELS